MSAVPPSRLATCNAAPIDPKGDYVLYWMIAARRAEHSFALDRAVELARELGKPLVIFEALRVGYRWASDRIHRFVLDGMADDEARFAQSPALYYPYVEPSAGAGKGLLAALAARACAVITDDFPAFFLPRMVAAAAARCPVRMEKVDGNGLLPIRAGDKIFTTARSLRYFLQKNLREHLAFAPRARPFEGVTLPRLGALPKEITTRWPRASAALLAGDAAEIARLPIDHGVPVAPQRGGAVAAEQALSLFLAKKLGQYPEERNHPDSDGASGLSPYLHFGHVSVHAVFAALAEKARWSPKKLAVKVNGLREGWWGAPPEVEAFLDELITWRELGYNMCAKNPDYDTYGSLPDWARGTLEKHGKDRRPVLYTRAQLEGAKTHDPIWNAAQRQLLAEGRMHNYLRMLWGKKVLEWSKTPQEAIDTLIELNNKYALDGRNPNSYSGIFWVFGRYDRAWGPEREIFGTVRYMSSDSTKKKLHLSEYLARWGALPKGGAR
jgi:deoxyribodipyrimidine photo-lyase